MFLACGAQHLEGMKTEERQYFALVTQVAIKMTGLEMAL